MVDCYGWMTDADMGVSLRVALDHNANLLLQCGPGGILRLTVPEGDRGKIHMGLTRGREGDISIIPMGVHEGDKDEVVERGIGHIPRLVCHGDQIMIK